MALIHACRRTSRSAACNGLILLQLLLAVLAVAAVKGATTFSGSRSLTSATPHPDITTGINSTQYKTHTQPRPSTGSTRAISLASPALSIGSPLRWEHYSKPGEETINLIVVFKHQKHLAIFSPICNRAKLLRRQQRLQRSRQKATGLGVAMTGMISNGSHADVELKPTCAALLGSCRHLFKFMIPGEKLVQQPRHEDEDVIAASHIHQQLPNSHQASYSFHNHCPCAHSLLACLFSVSHLHCDLLHGKSMGET